jgi:hypothetical protein
MVPAQAINAKIKRGKPINLICRFIFSILSALENSCFRKGTAVNGLQREPGKAAGYGRKAVI